MVPEGGEQFRNTPQCVSNGKSMPVREKKAGGGRMKEGEEDSEEKVFTRKEK